MQTPVVYETETSRHHKIRKVKKCTLDYQANDMEISEFISAVPTDRQSLFAGLHNTILNNDPGVKPVVKPMMGKDMILYEERGYMKYGLASAKIICHCIACPCI